VLLLLAQDTGDLAFEGGMHLRDGRSTSLPLCTLEWRAGPIVPNVLNISPKRSARRLISKNLQVRVFRT
jgi:hypothetical protein